MVKLTTLGTALTNGPFLVKQVRAGHVGHADYSRYSVDKLTVVNKTVHGGSGNGKGGNGLRSLL